MITLLKSLIKPAFLCLVLCFTASMAFSQSRGCLTAFGSLYYVESGTTAGGLPNFLYRTEADKIANPQNECKTAIGATDASCNVHVTTSGTPFDRSGTLVLFGPVQCPLDDYGLPLLCVAGGLGVYFLLRKRQA